MDSGCPQKGQECVERGNVGSPDKSTAAIVSSLVNGQYMGTFVMI
jgi:hypothetical protein